VPVYAVGVGSENFVRMVDNTEIPNLILKAAGK
jgi:alkaline phosphatase